MNYRASNITTVTLNTDRLIVSGQTITVFGFIISNATDQAAKIRITNGNSDNLIVVVVPCQDSKVVDIEWIADKGVKACSINSVEVDFTIFHSQVGS